MLVLSDTISIDCTPEKIWEKIEFFFQNSKQYKVWHKNHISCFWKKGKDFLPGSILIAEELIDGKRYKLGFKIMVFNRDDLLEYKMLFPYSIVCPKGNFKLIPQNNSTLFTAQLSFRPGFVFKFLFKKQIEGLKSHMREEGHNLKLIIERSHIKTI